MDFVDMPTFLENLSLFIERISHVPQDEKYSDYQSLLMGNDVCKVLVSLIENGNKVEVINFLKSIREIPEAVLSIISSISLTNLLKIGN